VPVNQPPLTRRSSTVTGHPRVSKAAVFDIITPDLENGPLAASAEVLTLVNDCLKSFPNLAENYEVHISHSKSRI
jgi:translation initiation factor 2-alpha kinase 4